MRLTLQARNELHTLLDRLTQAQEMIRNPRTVVCVRSHGTTTLDYKRPDGTSVYEIDKDIGSDLTGLYDGIELIHRFLQAH